MEGGVHRGRWNKSALVGIILLLMVKLECKHVSTSTLLPSEELCPDEDYRSSNGFCCNKCFAGTKFVKECNSPGHRTTCEPCPNREYTDQMNFSKNCRRCRTCKESKNEEEVSPCERNKNTICRCKKGYYKSVIDSETYECRKCAQCRPDEKEKQKCTPERNTVCECTEMYYRVNNKCEPCKNCTAECGRLCLTPAPGTGPGKGNEYLINIICGAGAVALVMLVLVIVITYVVTKWLTKKRLLQTSSQPSDDSPDSSQSFTLLIPPVESSNNISVEAVPLNLSEQEQLSNLPDCVPLEIKIPDLIYTVLDLVPVLRVKQLVRSLSVKDSEIEQAELDYRSCREAHYQMLRIWTEKGSRAGGMLHQPLLQELLNELRKMHLGRAAEELETKYGIQ